MNICFRFWLNAASEETLLTSFAELAQRLPVFPAKEAPDQRKLMSELYSSLFLIEEKWGYVKESCLYGKI